MHQVQVNQGKFRIIWMVDSVACYPPWDLARSNCTWYMQYGGLCTSVQDPGKKISMQNGTQRTSQDGEDNSLMNAICTQDCTWVHERTVSCGLHLCNRVICFLFVVIFVVGCFLCCTDISIFIPKHPEIQKVSYK